MIMRIGLVLIGIMIFTSCKKDKVEAYEPTPFSINIPVGFPDMLISADNPLTVEGVDLGRRLYYDKLLHPDQTMSCSSCHSQSNAFTTQSSNSLAHINLGWAKSFLWNGKVEGTLEDIMLFEVEEFFKSNLVVLNQDEEYPRLFYKAFGVGKITSREAAYALAQFFRTLNSSNSKYDKVLRGEATFTPEEWDGYDIFFTERGDCFHCHGGILYTDNLFHNNALDSSPEPGRYTVSKDQSDYGKFKTPTLRNVELTGPYMHDGRFQSLEEVIAFYSNGLQWSETVDPLMKKVSSGGVQLSIAEQQNLIAFLKTLTDQSFITNQNLADPF